MNRFCDIIPLCTAAILFIVLNACKPESKVVDALPQEEEEKAETVDVIPVDVPIDSLRNLVSSLKPEIDSNDEQLVALYEQTKPVFDILYKIVRSSTLDNTPQNNLNWYRVNRDLIESSGMSEKHVFSTINKIFEWYEGGDQPELNYAAYMRRVIAHYQELERLSTYLESNPSQLKEYETWSAIQAINMDIFIKDMYEYNHYSSLPMDISGAIVYYLNTVTSLFKKQNELLNGKAVQLPPAPAPAEDSEGLALPLEDERVTALIAEWEQERQAFSKTLPSKTQKAYDQITLLLKDAVRSIKVPEGWDESYDFGIDI
ncbi:MAG: hypothetical protein J1E63_07180 [Muribaculaceae bacterium]|nr:hypothetical protein [Muribaculaceae bacterium]